MVTVNGHLPSLDSCNIIKESDASYEDALKQIIQDHKEYANEQQNSMKKEIQRLEDKLTHI